MQSFLTQLPVYKEKLENDGFVIVDDIYKVDEIDNLCQYTKESSIQRPNFRTNSDLFAIRNLLGEIPEMNAYVWNEALYHVSTSLFGSDYFCVKSIFFDKPPLSNWVVAWHQDMMISVDKKITMPGFGPWVSKHNAYNVQPPVALLENLYTIRIHLDDCDETNGALRIIPGSHRQGILTSKQILEKDKNEYICSVKKGGIMIMKPLLLHSSSRSTANRSRRVIHLEFTNQQLPENLQWKERIHPQTNHSNT